MLTAHGGSDTEETLEVVDGGGQIGDGVHDVVERHGTIMPVSDDEWSQSSNRDHVAGMLAMTIVEERPGRAVVVMTVRDDMVNALGVCHGGMIFTLADTAMAYASNAAGPVALAASASIEFLRPVTLGTVLTATCVAVATTARSVVHDTTVTADDGATVAIFRGRTVVSTR
jgi:acyl-CoA thioesterase